MNVLLEPSALVLVTRPVSFVPWVHTALPAAPPHVKRVGWACFRLTRAPRIVASATVVPSLPLQVQQGARIAQPAPTQDREAGLLLASRVS